MKVATFNINGINRRLPNLLAWLAEAAPDVVCLQETRTSDRGFPSAALADAGYQAVLTGDGGYNGVAILARGAAPVLIRKALPGDPTDLQPRYLEAAVTGVIVACLYLPNGNPQPGPKFAYKLDWFRRLIAHADGLYATGLPIVLAGDFNVVPTAADIYPTTSWKNNALVQPESRAAFAQLLAQGWADSLRVLHPGATDLFSFWDYKRNRWPRNAGLRIDHILLSAALRPALHAGGVNRDVRGAEAASDHAPVWVEVTAPKSAKRRR